MRKTGRAAMLPLAGVLACAFDSGGQGGGQTATIATTMMPGDESSSAETGTPVETTGDGSTVTDASAETGGCIPGNITCPCDAGECFDVLSCVDGVCTSPSCSNQIVEDGEQCDDGNPVDDDGCNADCSRSQRTARVFTGINHSCALFHTGEVRCWGDGAGGKTGHGDVLKIGDDEPASTAITLPLADVAELALGAASTCARMVSGDITCWGSYAEGRLGYGMLVTQDIGDTEPAGSAGAVDIGGPAIDIAAGEAHNCAVRSDGAVFCWGRGASGQLGRGEPLPVGALERPIDRGPIDLGGAAATQVVAGLAHTCVLLDTQAVRCWGSHDHGVLGDPALTQPYGDSPGEVPAVLPDLPFGAPVVAIDAGNQHNCALMANAEIRCWGFGNGGRLGLGSNDDVALPAIVNLGGAARQVVAGRAHTCALRQDGILLCWGTGDSGKLGSGNNMNLGDAPEELPSLLLSVVVHDEMSTSILDVDAGGDHTCARISGGRVRCWGEANDGQLGYGDTADIGGGGPTIALAGDVPIGAP